MVQRRPSRSPASAITSAPVHSAAMAAPCRAARRSQVSSGRVIARFTPSPPTTTTVVSRPTSPSRPSAATVTPFEARAGAPLSVSTLHS